MKNRDCLEGCQKDDHCGVGFHAIPSTMGDDSGEFKPENGAYHNMFVRYEANGALYFYTADGAFIRMPTAIADYDELSHKPTINGVILEGNATLEELGIEDLVNREASARKAADNNLRDAISAERDARESADADILSRIPTVNDAALTIQRNGSQVASFTANDADDVTANIEVPIYTSDLVNNSGFITSSALSDYYTSSQVDSAIAAEASDREAADQSLQGQIDALSSASDVVDVVGTYAELQSYDTTDLKDNDIIKVLTDSTHDDAISYYRWNSATSSFSYIGSQGPFYTKSETDAAFVPQTRTVNGKALSSNITLDASDVGALPSSTVIPTVNNAALTVKKNGNTVATFTANSAADVTADISVPTKTSDLTNDSNFVSDASYVHTDNNFTTTEKNKLAGIAAGAEVNVQSDWNQTSSSADDYIKNKPSIPAKTSDLTNDSGYISTLPIAGANTLGAIKVGTNLSIAADGTLSADAQSITVDSTLSSSSTNPVENRVIKSALDDKADASSLATVATSGNYNDLTNKPTIPTVNNATLTIQRNGTTVDTFTANASQDKSINIAVPTTTSSLTNDSGFLTSIPTASANTLGGVMVGAGLSITNGVLSTTGGGVADAVEWANVLNRPSDVSYWTNDAGYITSAALPTKTSDLTNDGSDGTSAYIEADELSAVATSGSYNDLANKPTIPTVNDATLTIQRNSVTVDTFTANASQNKSINIVVPTKTSDLTNDSGFLNSIAWGDVTGKPTFATVATSGSYNDLSNKPAIGNATLTVQKNGSTIDTFTANATTNKTIDVTVPTATSDLTNDSGYLSYESDCVSSTDGFAQVLDSIGSPLDSFTLYGNASQDGTPTPDSPVPVQVVTGENTVKITGKNLFDINDIQRGSIVVSDGVATATAYQFYSAWHDVGTGLLATYPQQLSISAEAYTEANSTQGSGVGLRIRIIYTDGTSDYTTWYNNDLDFTRRTVVSNASKTIERVEFSYNVGGQNIWHLRNIQLELGSTATTYEPYQGQEYEVNLDSIELAKIGDYQDKIIKTDGTWYIHKEVGKVVLDGSENWGLSGQTTNNQYYLNFTGFPSSYYPIDSVMCDRFQVVRQDLAYNTKDLVGIGGWQGSEQIRISFDANIVDRDLASFKTWLASNPTTVYYALATPTDTEITNSALVEQLDSILSASLYKGTNNVVLTGTGAQGEFELCYNDLAKVAYTGDYNDLKNKLTAGAGISIDANNVISSASTSNTFASYSNGTLYITNAAQNADTENY